MKQVLQDLRSGAVTVREVPEPVADPGRVLVAVERSLISAGTERASATLGAKSLLQKARARPDLVRKTIEVARAEGVAAAGTKVRSRLDQYSAFVYSLSGRVLDGGGDPRLAPGVWVACVGAGYASHAEVVRTGKPRRSAARERESRRRRVRSSGCDRLARDPARKSRAWIGRPRDRARPDRSARRPPARLGLPRRRDRPARGSRRPLRSMRAGRAVQDLVDAASRGRGADAVSCARRPRRASLSRSPPRRPGSCHRRRGRRRRPRSSTVA